ncbi:MAG TPA: ankyrin repeat domain-containing protein [Bradyrhizobium sp.]|nr:ankyrin repeat domain-containing protein [Bradyrhizobium sp.]
MTVNTNCPSDDRQTINDVYSKALKQAAFQGETERLVALIAAGTNVNEPDCGGDTPLMLAAARGYANIAAILLRNGADVSARNDEGRTALHQAAYGGHVATVEALLGAGSPINARDNGGSTPLICAAFGGSIDVAMALLTAGADTKIKNIYGYGALDIAERKGLDLSGKLLRFERRNETTPSVSERQAPSKSVSAGARR